MLCFIYLSLRRGIFEVPSCPLLPPTLARSLTSQAKNTKLLIYPPAFCLQRQHLPTHLGCTFIPSPAPLLPLVLLKLQTQSSAHTFNIRSGLISQGPPTSTASHFRHAQQNPAPGESPSPRRLPLSHSAAASSCTSPPGAGPR